MPALHSLYYHPSPYQRQWQGIFPSKQEAIEWALRQGWSPSSFSTRLVRQYQLFPTQRKETPPWQS